MEELIKECLISIWEENMSPADKMVWTEEDMEFMRLLAQKLQEKDVQLPNPQ